MLFLWRNASQSDNPHKGKRTHQKKPQLKCEQCSKKECRRALWAHLSPGGAGCFPRSRRLSSRHLWTTDESLFGCSREKTLCSVHVGPFFCFILFCVFFLYQLCPALKQHENFVGSVLLARNPVTFMDPEGNGDLTNAMGLNQYYRPGVGFSPAQNSSGSSASGPSAPPQSWSVLIWTTQSSFHPDICS